MIIFKKKSRKKDLFFKREDIINFQIKMRSKFLMLFLSFSRFLVWKFVKLLCNCGWSENVVGLLTHAHKCRAFAQLLKFGRTHVCARAA